MLDKPLLELALSTYRKIQPDPSGTVKVSANASHPTVREVLKRMSALPTGSMLVGSGEDGLPFLLDLDQPASGALLLCGDPGCGKTRLMQSMAGSLPVMNSSREARYAVITARPDEWQGKVIQPQCLGIYDASGEDAPRLVTKLLSLAEQRSEQNQTGPAFVIFVDDLMSVQTWDRTAQVNLHWLIQYGALSRIWVVAGVAAADAAEISYWIDAFRTRLIGHTMVDPKQMQTIAGNPGLDAGTIHARIQFAIWFEDKWQTFRAPEPGSPILKDEVRDEYRHVVVR